MGTAYAAVATDERHIGPGRLARPDGPLSPLNSDDGVPDSRLGNEPTGPASSWQLLRQKSSDTDELQTDQHRMKKCYGVGGEGGEEEEDEEEAPEECKDRPRTPIVTGPIIELRGREVIFAIGVFFLVAVVVGLIVVLVSGKVKDIDAKGQTNMTMSSKCEEYKELAERYCLTAQCIRTAAEMMSNMNATVDPCDDFWMYSCGGYLARVEVPPGKDAWGIDNEVTERIRIRIQKILESDVKRNETDSAERKFKTFYRKCMDVDEIERLGELPFIDIINQFGGWAIFDDWNLLDKPGQWTAQRALEILHDTYDIDAFFSLEIGKDDKDTDTDIIQFDQGGLILNRRDYLLNENSSARIISYKKYMSNVALLFNISQSDADKFAETTFQTEKRLALIHLDENSPQRQNPEAMYNIITVDQLQANAPRINWLKLLRRMFGDVDGSTTVLLTSRDYLTNVSDLIRTIPDSDVNNYLVWQLMHKFAASHLSKALSDLHAKFMRADKMLPANANLRQHFCQKKTGEWFQSAITAAFITQELNNSLTDIREMVSNIKTTFNRTLNNNGWMDGNTTREALLKVDKMVERIGYPEFITDEETLDRFYEAINEEQPFFENILNALKYQRIGRKKTLELSNETQEWSMSPYDLNAFYSFTENLIGFTAGILQRPFYHKESPKYVNYGAIGTTIAHEITHAFDILGSQYDSKGNLREWWTPETKKKFNERTDCVEKHYLLMKPKDIQDDDKKVASLNENIADMAGLKMAYKAYKQQRDSKVREKMLPILELTSVGDLELANDRTFFVAFAQNWCKYRTKESRQRFIQQSNHALEETRVIGSVAQNDDFQTVFKCSKDAKMNPSHKCTVW